MSIGRSADLLLPLLRAPFSPSHHTFSDVGVGGQRGIFFCQTSI
jgi:hypothetical protein